MDEQEVPFLLALSHPIRLTLTRDPAPTEPPRRVQGLDFCELLGVPAPSPRLISFGRERGAHLSQCPRIPFWLSLL